MDLRRLSAGERAYLREGIAADLRADGRACLDARDFVVETSVVAQANGSARVVLDTTDVLVGIKVEFGEPDAETPNEGRILCSVECAASASQMFKGRGGEAINLELTAILEGVLSKGRPIDLTVLGIIPRRQCWVLYVDAIVLDFGGNVVDAMIMAARAALHDLRIPKVVVNDMESEAVSIDILEDPSTAIALDISRVPLSVSLYKVGEHVIADPALAEEACADAALVVAVNKAGHVCMVRKRGRGGMDPRFSMEMVKTSRKIALTLIDKLDKTLAVEAQSTGPRYGFFADRFFSK